MLRDLCTLQFALHMDIFESYFSFVPAIHCVVPLGILNILADKPCVR